MLSVPGCVLAGASAGRPGPPTAASPPARWRPCSAVPSTSSRVTNAIRSPPAFDAATFEVWGALLNATLANLDGINSKSSTQTSGKAVVYVHLTDHALAAGNGVLRVEGDL